MNEMTALKRNKTSDLETSDIPTDLESQALVKTEESDEALEDNLKNKKGK